MTQAKKIHPLAKKVFERHLAQLQKVVEQKGVKGVKALYRRAETDLSSRLRRTNLADDKVGPTTMRAMQSQLDAVLGLAQKDMKDLLADSSKLASRLGARHGVDEFKTLAKNFKGTEPAIALDRAAIFEGLVSGVDSSLLRRHDRISGQWASRAIDQIEQKLAVGVLTGKPLSEVVDDVMKVGGISEKQRWVGERIARTEIAYAHGSAKHAALRELAEDEPELQKRVLEMVDDDRVGDDSLLIHGQTVPVSQPFTWKRKTKGGWVLEEFLHPPNRPNDRAVVIPWDPSWDADEEEQALSIAELHSAPPTRWRKKTGVKVPPGHHPGKSYLPTGKIHGAASQDEEADDEDEES